MRFNNKKITTMLGLLPEMESYFDDEIGNYSFTEKQSMRLKKVMGYNCHRLSKESTTVSDFAIYGINYMFANNWINRNEIGAIVVVSLCPDYFVPHISNIIQAECGFGENIICLDIAQGCCGFLVGLMQSFMLLEHIDKKVLLVNGDVISHKVSRRDRNDYPLIGDAACITVLENSESSPIYFEMNTDGKRRNALIIPAGGFKMPCNIETAKVKMDSEGNYRSLDNICMDGSEVFNFVQSDVSKMLKDAFDSEHKTIEDFDYFFFHQPNKFMLKKLAQKVGIPFDKFPMNLVENFGNPSGASIPMTAIFNARDELINKNNSCCLSAFGSGLAWGVVFMDIGNLNNCEIIESDL
ncbi:MAG: hypothetical protein IJ232_01065 [Lachnospiraceae bacterium]|nr:hypothetical protein [Lachnospiraceae bacterium]